MLFLVSVTYIDFTILDRLFQLCDDFKLIILNFKLVFQFLVFVDSDTHDTGNPCVVRTIYVTFGCFIILFIYS